MARQPIMSWLAGQLNSWPHQTTTTDNNNRERHMCQLCGRSMCWSVATTTTAAVVWLIEKSCCLLHQSLHNTRSMSRRLLPIGNGTCGIYVIVIVTGRPIVTHKSPVGVWRPRGARNSNVVSSSLKLVRVAPLSTNLVNIWPFAWPNSRAKWGEREREFLVAQLIDVIQCKASSITTGVVLYKRDQIATSKCRR